jgi:hypothetical protein
MPPRPRKSSACVTLVLLGAAALAGCGDSNAPNRRAQYATKEACLADWGDPAECEQQVAPSTGSSSSGHYYWGPRGGYSGSTRSGSSSSSSSSSSGHSISRGGFGSHGSSSS